MVTPIKDARDCPGLLQQVSVYHNHSLPRAVVRAVGLLCVVLGISGCGSVQSRDATQQLLMSNAIDRSIASIDFSPLSGKKVYLDTQYVNLVKGAGFVNSDYVISSLRQQMTASHCLLQETRAEAELIVEARVGTLGTDDHEIVYGIPANNALGSATSLVSNMPSVPAIPELSLAKKRDQTAAAKLGLFAYHRESREPFWQSGLAQTKSNAKDVWFFGAGPFQQGTIYDRTQFAGGDFAVKPFEQNKPKVDEIPQTKMAAYAKSRRFGENDALRKVEGEISLANHEEPVAPSTPASAAPAAVATPPPATAPATSTPPASATPAAAAASTGAPATPSPPAPPAPSSAAPTTPPAGSSNSPAPSSTPAATPPAGASTPAPTAPATSS